MAGYIFLPVPTEEMLEEARYWTQGQQDKGKIPYEVLHNSSPEGLGKALSRFTSGGCLKGVPADSKVYILLHGAGEPDSRFVGAQRPDGEYKKYTPKEMAALLTKEGLTKQIQAVNVYACGSGMAGDVMLPWAERLKSEMNLLGFRDVRVGGYTADVKTSYVHRYIQALTGAVFSNTTHKGAYDEDVGGEIRASATKVIF
ncbi:hypothetical protein AB4Z01_20850 [Inquilinus sp. YAF38]|uniref:hypothetical protein n=1 Tax=Inquilinus sp. YAF38 TaxID=3233084 RepID=UPI003F8EF869